MAKGSRTKKMKTDPAPKAQGKKRNIKAKPRSQPASQDEPVGTVTLASSGIDSTLTGSNKHEREDQGYDVSHSADTVAKRQKVTREREHGPEPMDVAENILASAVHCTMEEASLASQKVDNEFLSRLAENYDVSMIRLVAGELWVPRPCASSHISCDRGNVCHNCEVNSVACDGESGSRLMMRLADDPEYMPSSASVEALASLSSHFSQDEGQALKRRIRVSMVENKWLMPLDPQYAVPERFTNLAHPKPPPQGQPKIWAEASFTKSESRDMANKHLGQARQALCESINYFKSHQSGSYYKDGGGGMTKVENSHEMVFEKDQTDAAAQYKAVRMNMERDVPLVIIVGDGNRKCPSAVPHKYNVLALFKVANMWAEKEGRNTIFKYRFEKVLQNEPSWWSPADPGLQPLPAQYPDPVENECYLCHQSCPQVYNQGWMCLNHKCKAFWKMDGWATPGELSYDLRFLKQRRTNPTMATCYQLQPSIFHEDPQVEFGHNVSRAAWKGFVCPQCGRCNSRIKWSYWQCLTVGCHYTRQVTHNILPLRALSDPQSPFGWGFRLPNYAVGANIATKTYHAKQWLIYRHEVPECGFLYHFVANKAINEQAGSADEMWNDLQQADLGLSRCLTQSKVPGPFLGRQFLANFGMPYKFVSKVDSRSFEDACRAVLLARTRMNWAGRYVAGDLGKTHQEFNELLTLGYFQDQSISFHDDGEKGLGPTIATLSVGCPAKMTLRMKAKHFCGHFKSKYVAEKPVPGCCRYEERKAEYEKWVATSPEGRDAKGKSIVSAFKIKSKHGPAAVTIELNHGDIVIMHGADIQKYYEHAVVPEGLLRFALTCRYIDPASLAKDNVPRYEVKPDEGIYDGENPATAPLSSAGPQSPPSGTGPSETL
ncbi:MAG: hypothetical protein M1819_006626 [Sarea resinae]|nr:MAG: hypothetical protein M1819_006626 [Sarea resinae]